MSKITFLTGDATQPQDSGNKLIVHVCNDINLFGAGFALAISNRWNMPKAVYHTSAGQHVLGNVQFVPVEDDVTVVNMIAQHGVRSADNPHPIRYDAVRECLKKVNDYAIENNASIHMPRIGCGLAGGKWEEIAKIIQQTLTVDVYVYDFK